MYQERACYNATTIHICNQFFTALTVDFNVFRPRILKIELIVKDIMTLNSIINKRYKSFYYPILFINLMKN